MIFFSKWHFARWHEPQWMAVSINGKLYDLMRNYNQISARWIKMYYEWFHSSFCLFPHAWYNNLNQLIQTKPDQKLSLFWASLYSSSYSWYDALCTAYIRITLSPPKYTYVGNKKMNFLPNQNGILFTSVNGASAWYLNSVYVDPLLIPSAPLLRCS